MYDITDLISKKRLDKYENELPERALDLYILNVRLCSSLYVIIHFFEIMFRNKVDLIFSKHLGANWIFDAQYHIGENIGHMKNAIEKLSSMKDKNASKKDNLISELGLGFWTRLFDKDYMPLVWDKHPEILREIFSFHKNKEKVKLSAINGNVNSIRKYRNKISHHGSVVVCSDGKGSCAVMHRVIAEAIRTIAGNAVLTQIMAIDNFTEIYVDGIKQGLLKKTKN